MKKENMNTGHGITLAGLFVGMGLCIHAGAYLGAGWLLLLYLAGWYFVGQAESEKEASTLKPVSSEVTPVATAPTQS